MDTTSYKQTSFGLFVPSHIADQLQHLDMTTCTLYESHLRNVGKAESTVEKYGRFIQQFVLFLGDHCLSVSYVRAWLEKLKKTRHINTVNNAVSALNGFFKWLDRADCTVSFFPSQEPQYREDRRNLEKAEFDRMLTVADERMRTLLLTFFGTGIRVSELKFFTVESVRAGKIVVENKGKTRMVFLDPETKAHLIGYCERKKITGGVIFRNRSGGALSRSFIWRALKALARKAHVELSKVFPHNLRHLFAVERYKAEKDLDGLRLDMGHSLISTTQRYLKETAEKHYERVMKRGALTEGQKKNPTIAAG